MDNRIYDEKKSLWYEKQGDYYIPCIELCEKETQYIGMWGQQHANFSNFSNFLFFSKKY